MSAVRSSVCLSSSPPQCRFRVVFPFSTNKSHLVLKTTGNSTIIRTKHIKITGRNLKVKWNKNNTKKIRKTSDKSNNKMLRSSRLQVLYSYCWKLDCWIFHWALTPVVVHIYRLYSFHLYTALRLPMYVCMDILPLVILQFWTSFSHDANDAFRTSASFLFVPGVNGGICVGTSVK